MTTPPAIEVREVSRRFGRRVALDGLTLTLPPGRAYGFLGPNGAGKTTLIKLLLGLKRPSTGEIRLFGRAVPREASAALPATHRRMRNAAGGADLGLSKASSGAQRGCLTAERHLVGTRELN